MTVLAKWIALCCVAGLVSGLWLDREPLALFSVAMLLWMLVVYARFRWQTWRALRSLTVVRSVHGRTDTKGILWAGRTYEIEVAMTCDLGRMVPEWHVRDLVPEIFEVLDRTEGSGKQEIPSSVQGPSVQRPSTSMVSSSAPLGVRLRQILESQFSGWIARWSYLNSLHRDEPNAYTLEQSTTGMRYRYRIRPRGAGHATLMGIRLLAQDRMRWFRVDRVIPSLQTFQVMPHYRGLGELRPAMKLTNAIPQHGIHRQRRPGMGFELLELREYVDGDPPKSIAWKATARRDVLMTRQYESEIPIRMHLFLEGSDASRIGGYGLRLLDQMNTVAMSLTRIATQGGDWVGAYLIGSEQTNRVAAASGQVGFYRMAKALADFSIVSSPHRFGFSRPMQESAYAIVSEYYPERLNLEINPDSFSWWGKARGSFYRRRVQLAGVLAHWYGLHVRQHVQLLVDDGAYAALLQSFLCEHGRAWMAPIVPASEIARMTSQQGLDRMIRSMQQAASRAKDNEVFVIFADLLSRPRNTNELIDAFKMIKGRHHRVAVVCTTPNFARPTKISFETPTSDVETWRRLGEQVRIAESANRVKKKLREIGVPMAFSGEPHSVPLVLTEIDIARSGRLKGTSSTS